MSIISKNMFLEGNETFLKSAFFSYEICSVKFL